MDRQKLYSKLATTIAHGLIGVKSVLEHTDPHKAYIPPTHETVAHIMRNEVIVVAHVKTMVHRIIHDIDEELGSANRLDKLERRIQELEGRTAHLQILD